MKIFSKIFLTTVFVSLGFVLLAPSIASSSWGKAFLFDLIQKKTSYKISAESLSLSWFTGTEVENLFVEDETKNTLSLKSLKSDASLFSLLFLKGYEKENLHFSDLNFKFNHASTTLSDGKGAIQFIDGNVLIDFSGITQDKDQKGSFNFSTKIEETLYLELLHKKNWIEAVFSKKALKKTFKNNFYLKASVEKFPVALLEQALSLQHPDLKGVLSLVLGKFIDFQIDTTKNKTLKGEVKATNVNASLSFSPLEEPLFEATIKATGPLKEILGNELVVKGSPAEEQFFFALDLFSNTLQAKNLHLIQDFPYVQSTDSPFFIEISPYALKTLLSFFQQEEALELKQTVQIEIEADPKTGLHFSSKKPFHLAFLEKGSLFLPELKGELTKKKISFSTSLNEIHWNNHPIQKATDPLLLSFSRSSDALFLHISSDFLKGELTGTIDNEVFSLKKKALFHMSPSLPLGEFSSPIDISVSTLSFSFENFLQTLDIKGNASTPLFKWVDHEINDLSLFFSFLGTDEKGDLFLKGISHKHPHSLSIHLEEAFNEPLLHFDVIGKKIPSSLADVFFTENSMKKLFGEHIDLNANGLIALKTPLSGEITASIASPKLTALLSFDLKDGLKLKKDKGVSEAHFQFSPDAFNILVTSLKDTQNVLLKNTAKISLILEEFHVPWKEKASPQKGFYLDFLHASISSKLLIDRLDFIDIKTHSPSSFDHIKGSFETTSLDQMISFNLEANQIDSKDASSDLFFKGKLSNAIDSSLNFNLKGLSLVLSTKGFGFSAPLFCDLFLFDPAILPQVEALLGPKVNFDIDFEIHAMTGPIKAYLQGNNGELQLRGDLQNGTLSLYEDLLVKVKATPALGEEILKDVVPFFGGVLGASDPFLFTIKKEGFSFPLFPLNLNNASIGHASLSLGKVFFKNEGDLKSILDIFKYQRTDTITVWATPIYASLNRGMLQVSRLDLLLMDKFHVATWGNINFPRDQVNFTIALSGSAIESAFNVKGLSDNYFMQLPLKGRTGNASIDKGKAVARVTALVAKQTGVEGFILGTVLDIASGKLAEPPPPAPTTHPFPWR